MFGATGDGSTDDTTAIQNALDWLETRGKGRVLFPDGVYVTTDILRMRASYAQLVGSGRGTTKIKFTGSSNVDAVLLVAQDDFGPLTNLTSSPRDLTSAPWIDSDCTVTANDADGPDGTTTADKLDYLSGGYVYQVVNSSGSEDLAGKAYTFEAWVKAGTKTTLDLRLYNHDSGTDQIVTTFPLDAGVWQLLRVRRTFTDAGNEIGTTFSSPGEAGTIWVAEARLTKDWASSSSYVQNVHVSGITFEGNGKAEAGLRLHSCHDSTFRDLGFRTCPVGFWSRFAVCNQYHGLQANTLHGGSQSPAPIYGFIFDEGRVGEATTAGNAADLRAAGMANVGIWLRHASHMAILAGASEGNLWGVRVSSSSLDNTIKLDCESNTEGDFEVGGSSTKLLNCQSTVLTRIWAGNNVQVDGGLYEDIEIDGSLSTPTVRLSGVVYNIGGSGAITDGVPTRTRISGCSNSNGGVPVTDYARAPEDRTIPVETVSGIDTLDAVFRAFGSWRFATGGAYTRISETVVTTGMPWRAVLRGIWQDNDDGANLVQTHTYIEVTSAAATYALGDDLSVTFSVDGSGYFRGTATTVSAGNAAVFRGEILFLNNDLGDAGTNSIQVKGNVDAGGTLFGAGLDVSGDAEIGGDATVTGTLTAATIVDGTTIQKSATSGPRLTLKNNDATSKNNGVEFKKSTTLIAQIYTDTDGDGGDEIVVDAANGGPILFKVSNTEVARLTSAGLILTVGSAPASASASGTTGQLAYDGSYLYICTATNTWRRIAHATW